MTIDRTHNLPTLSELESFERAGILRGFGMSELGEELARLRSEHDRAATLAGKIETARLLLAEHQRKAAIQRIELTAEPGSPGAALLVTTGVGLVASFEREGVRVEIHARAVGFIHPELWNEPGVEQQLRAVAAREMSGRVGLLFEPGAARADLLARIPTDRELPPMSIPRNSRVEVLAASLPLTPLVAGWFRVALDSHDEAAPVFCRVLRRRFGEENLVHMLEQQSAAE